MNVFMNIGNFFIKALLRSPFHGLMSKNSLVLTYTGRKSGKVYSTPTNYSQEGDTIWIMSHQNRVWWRNLVGGAPVTLRLRGKDLNGFAEALRREEEVAQGLTLFLTSRPDDARYFDITLDEESHPTIGDLTRATKRRVVVEIKLMS